MVAATIVVAMSTTNESIGDRVRAAREAAHISARALDRKAGLTEGHTSLIEAGRNLEVGTAAKLAVALGVSLDWLVFGSEVKPTGTCC